MSSFSNVNFNESLTNDVVSFEQLDPGFSIYLTHFYVYCYQQHVLLGSEPFKKSLNVYFMQVNSKDLRIHHYIFFLVSGYPANTQRSNNVFTTSLQRHDVAMT